jgi:four helix bundle protein
VAEINSYQDLVAWQRSMDLAVSIYEATRGFPQSELYGITSQLRRSAASIAANIAEGYGRESTGSYIQFLKIARGSLKELETHVILSNRVKLMGESQAALLLKETTRIGIILNALIRSLQERKPAERTED